MGTDPSLEDTRPRRIGTEPSAVPVVTTDAGHARTAIGCAYGTAEVVRELPLDADLVVMRRPISGG